MKTGGSGGNIALDLSDGDINGAITRGVVEAVTFGNSSAGRAAGLDEVTSKAVGAFLSLDLNLLVSKVTEKEDNKTVLKQNPIIK